MATDKQKLAAWQNAAPVPGLDPRYFRQDQFGNVMRVDLYGKDVPGGWNVDHKHPASKGGSEKPHNMQAMNPTANRAKSDKTPTKPRSKRRG